jgi:phage shock protein C
MSMSQRLYRSRTDTVLGGVAAGLADYLNADPALVRIAWAILVVVTGGLALLVYVVAWVVVPEEPESAPARAAEPTTDPVTGEVVEPVAPPPTPARARDSSGGSAGVIVGFGLVLVGAWFLVREFLPDFDWGLIWPLLLVGIGVLVLVTSMRRREGGR